jgi:biotin transport system substrate-specific component
MAATRRSTARDLAQIAVFAALIAALTLPGAIPTGIPGVPITLQTLGVMLAGAILGPRRGTFAVVVYVALGLIGLPIFSGGSAGLGVLVGPSGGYLIGFVLGAFLIGWGTARILPRYPMWAALIVTAVGGILGVYVVGAPWLAIATGVPLGAVLIGSAAYLPGDVLKVVLTVIVASQVHRAWPGLITPRRWFRQRRDTAVRRTVATEGLPTRPESESRTDAPAP